jgi:hypothetical protein
MTNREAASRDFPKRVGAIPARAALLALALLFATTTFGQTSAPPLKRATPIDPVAGIIEAFKTYRVVALGDNHDNEQAHAVRLALIRDPRFAAVANDIVVEFGNSFYQDVMDRFVRGERVPDATLRQVWQNTTQRSAVWDVPVYEEFFRTVREVNHSLPKERRLRVLLGDTAVDWEKVHTAEDLEKLGRSNGVPAGIIEREVLAKKRVLVIYGDAHLQRKNIYWTMQDQEEAEKRFATPPDTIVNRLEQGGIRVFSICLGFGDFSQRQADVASWRPPVLTRLTGTALGMTSSAFKGGGVAYFRHPDNTMEKITPDWERSPPIQDQFDAMLYLGTLSSMTYRKLPRALCDDAGYVRMRLERMRMGTSPNGETPTLSDCTDARSAQ